MEMQENYAKQLHYDVMGIAMAVRGHLGECALFQEIDAAVQTLDWRKMATIQDAFDMLSERQRDAIMGSGDDSDAGMAIQVLNQVLRTLVPSVQTRIA